MAERSAGTVEEPVSVGAPVGDPRIHGANRGRHEGRQRAVEREDAAEAAHG
jgi:hypothetical protein